MSSVTFVMYHLPESFRVSEGLRGVSTTHLGVVYDLKELLGCLEEFMRSFGFLHDLQGFYSTFRSSGLAFMVLTNI